MLVTLGLMTMEMSDSIRGPILAAESVVLLFMAIRRDNFIIQIGALIVSAIGVIYALIDIGERSPDLFAWRSFCDDISVVLTPGFVTSGLSPRSNRYCGRG